MKSTIITIGVVALIIIAGIAIYTSAEKECCDDEKNVSMEFPTVLKLSLGDGLKCTYQGKEYLNEDSIVLWDDGYIIFTSNVVGTITVSGWWVGPDGDKSSTYEREENITTLKAEITTVAYWGKMTGELNATFELPKE